MKKEEEEIKVLSEKDGFIIFLLISEHLHMLHQICKYSIKQKLQERRFSR